MYEPFECRGSYNGFGNGCGIFGRNDGFNNGKDVLDSSIVVILCQICFELKHTAAGCRNNTTNSLSFFPPSNYDSYQIFTPRVPILKHLKVDWLIMDGT